ncbi:three component ABC system middle component [Sphingobacterium siyangense]|uniref:three component ABC system middle component n=1 Tax=Sphingobacterium siyangense TaxID=459529 RepID=UPI002FDCFF42
MREIYYTYNNEAIASCAMLSILQKVKSMDIARACLILPFLLDDRTIANLKNELPIGMGLKDFIKEQQRLFVSFNKRYLALLPVCINSLLMLRKSGQIKIEKDIIDNSSINLDVMGLGERFASIQQAVPNFLSLFQNLSTAQLYQILKIQL